MNELFTEAHVELIFFIASFILSFGLLITDDGERLKDDQRETPQPRD